MPGSDPMPNLIWDVIPKIALVLILLYGSLLALRRISGTRRSGTDGSRLMLMNTLHLAPGRSVHLIGVAGKVVLVGATSQQVSLLTELEAVPEPVWPAETEVQPSFEEQLALARAALQAASSRLKVQKGGNPPSDEAGS